MSAHPEPPAPPRRQVLSWALWDWATQPFKSVMLTFVFVTLYLVSDAFLPDEIAAQNADGTLVCAQGPDAATEYCRGLSQLTEWYGWATFAAGIAVLLLAPVLGQRADASGSKKRWVVGATASLAVLQFSLFLVIPEPRFFWLGALLVAVASVVSDIAEVNYYALLVRVSTPRTMGRISGLGWGLGYLGGITALLIVVALDNVSWFGLDVSDGLAYRIIAAGAAVWTVTFAVPFVLNVPEAPGRTDRARVGFFRSYARLVTDIAQLFREQRATAGFLVASALYRDGLAGVFAFGGVLAAISFGFSATEVILFGVAANLIAGILSIVAGRLDNRFGARNIIVTALIVILIAGICIFAFRDGGKPVYWVGGVALAAMVGPAQASSRTLLARLTPTNMQGEAFGLYATTGRVMSFLAPLLWSVTIAWFGATHFGILGIVLLIAVGLVGLLFVPLPRHRRANNTP
ncbi:MFS transporter [Microbacterium sp.]|uniref:MFS transporter n=1 Tax=Microbacterium sp. TaxID=51671 RepID=UPI003A8826CA